MSRLKAGTATSRMGAAPKAGAAAVFEGAQAGQDVPATMQWSWPRWRAASPPCSGMGWPQTDCARSRSSAAAAEMLNGGSSAMSTGKSNAATSARAMPRRLDLSA